MRVEQLTNIRTIKQGIDVTRLISHKVSSSKQLCAGSSAWNKNIKDLKVTVILAETQQRLNNENDNFISPL